MKTSILFAIGQSLTAICSAATTILSNIKVDKCSAPVNTIPYATWAAQSSPIVGRASPEQYGPGSDHLVIIANDAARSLNPKIAFLEPAGPTHVTGDLMHGTTERDFNITYSPLANNTISVVQKSDPTHIINEVQGVENITKDRITLVDSVTRSINIPTPVGPNRAVSLPLLNGPKSTGNFLSVSILMISMNILFAVFLNS